MKPIGFANIRATNRLRKIYFSLIFSDLSFHRTEYFLGIEAHAFLKYPGDLPDVFDMLRNITVVYLPIWDLCQNRIWLLFLRRGMSA
jgi:hypothetical protein